MALILNSATDIEKLPSGRLSDFAYNAMDCCITLEVLNAIKPQLTPLTAATYEFSRLLQAPVQEMMLRGMMIDEERRVDLAQIMRTKIALLEKRLHRLIGAPWDVDVSDFNWRSNADLQWLFYDLLSLPPVKNDEGKPTVNRMALEKLQRYPFAKPYCRHILALRDAGKMLGVLVSAIDPDGRMRSTFSIAGTTSGRFSSYMSAFGRGQNLQNQDPEMRYVFIADPGKKLAYIDLEQAESRAVGAKIYSLFGDAGYLDAVESGGDVHTKIASMVWTHIRTRADAEVKYYRQFSYRDLAKRLGHATNYTGTPFALQSRIHVPVDLIVEFQTAYFKAFPGIREWHRWVLQQLSSKGYIISLTGRKRFFLGRHDDDHTLGEAVSYDPQETVARLLNQGLFKLWHAATLGHLDLQLLLQVHDAVVLQYPEEKEDTVLPAALSKILVPITLRSPTGQERTFTIPSEAKHGWNWGERMRQHDDGTEFEFDRDGLVKWKGPGRDTRTRFFNPATSLLHRRKRYYPAQAA